MKTVLFPDTMVKRNLVFLSTIISSIAVVISWQNISIIICDCFISCYYRIQIKRQAGDDLWSTSDAIPLVLCITPTASFYEAMHLVTASRCNSTENNNVLLLKRAIWFSHQIIMLENNTNQSLSHSGSILRRVTGPSTVDGCDSVFHASFKWWRQERWNAKNKVTFWNANVFFLED